MQNLKTCRVYKTFCPISDACTFCTVMIADIYFFQQKNQVPQLMPLKLWKLDRNIVCCHGNHQYLMVAHPSLDTTLRELTSVVQDGYQSTRHLSEIQCYALQTYMRIFLTCSECEQKMMKGLVKHLLQLTRYTVDTKLVRFAVICEIF